MPIQITGHHMEVTDAVRADIEGRAQHWLRIFDGLQSIRVTLSAQKERRVAEVVVTVSHGAPVIARVTAENLPTAIHEAAEKVETQLRRHKDRLRDHRARRAEAERPSAAAGAQPVPDLDAEQAPEEAQAAEGNDTTAPEEPR